MSGMSIRIVGLLALALVGLAGCGGSGGTSNGNNNGGDAYVRVYNASRDVGTVEVVLGNTLVTTLAPNVASTVYYTVGAGNTRVRFRDATTHDVLLDRSFTSTKGKAYLATLLGSRAKSNLTMSTAETRTTDQPDDKYQVRLLHAAPTYASRKGDLYISEPGDDLATLTPVLTDITYGQMTDYVVFATGKRFRVVEKGTKAPVIFDSQTLDLSGPHRTLTLVGLEPEGTLPTMAILIDHTNP